MTRDEAITHLTAVGQPYELADLDVFGQRMKYFRNAPRCLGEVYESARSEQPFLVYGDDRLSFEAFWQESRRFAGLLVGQYGVRRGDRVAISLRNYPEWMIAFAAATSVGAIAVALNALWNRDELSFALNDAEPKVLVVDQERLDRLGEAPPARCRVVVVRPNAEPPIWATSWDAAAREVHHKVATPLLLVNPEDDAMMLYTSGSTGRPKGVLSNHRAAVTSILSAELDGEIKRTTLGLPPPAEPQAVLLLTTPLFHVGALYGTFLTSFRAQQRVVAMYKWDVELAGLLIERERVTSLSATPAITGDLVAFGQRTDRDLSSLREIGGGGAARAPAQVQAIKAVFPDASPETGWGMTETNATGTGIDGADYMARPTSAGRPGAVLEMRVVDETGASVAPGTAGELQVRGVTLTRGYWRRPKANHEAFQDGWLRTGDLARFDEEGYLEIIDRLKDLIIRGGENIGCGSVEAALLEHPCVLEASVYGVPDERLGEEVAASVYVAPGLDAEGLQAFILSRLARHESPRHLHVSSTPLPRLATGKIAKRELRSEAIARLTV